MYFFKNDSMGIFYDQYFFMDMINVFLKVKFF